MKNKIQWLILQLSEKVDVIHWFALPVGGAENASIWAVRSFLYPRGAEYKGLMTGKVSEIGASLLCVWS